MNEVSQVEVEFSDGDVDVMRIDAERRMNAVRRLLQPLSVGALQRNGAKQDHHHQVEPPDLVGLTQAVDAPHLSLLVGVAEHARGVPMSGRDAVDEVLAAVLRDVLAQLRQQPRRPFLLRIRLLSLHIHTTNNTSS